MFTGPLEDRLAIRELFDDYADAVSRIDFDAYAACWSDDCVRRGTGGGFRGKDELRTHWDGIWRAVERMVFVTQIGAIEVDGDTAVARSYCLETMVLAGGQRLRLVGQYDDELRRTDGSWVFTGRDYRVAVDDG